MKIINLKQAILLPTSLFVAPTAHGGENIVKHNKGLGTTFTINLPL